MSTFSTFRKGTWDETLDNCILALTFSLYTRLTLSDLDNLPEVGVCLEYFAPCELLGNHTLASVVHGKTEKNIPVVMEGMNKNVDFRFLQGDLINEEPEIKIVTQLKDLIKGTSLYPSLLFPCLLMSLSCSVQCECSGWSFWFSKDKGSIRYLSISSPRIHF